MPHYKGRKSARSQRNAIKLIDVDWSGRRYSTLVNTPKLRIGLWLLAGALLAATLIAYSPAWHGGMVWDDDFHVTRPSLRSLHGLYRIWFEPGTTLQYYPLLHSAFWLEHRLWGDATLGYHLVNILLHVAASVMVALILRQLGVRGAFLAAAIFALHPVQVESVAWISELKNTLSAVFYLGAMLLYLQFDKSRKKSAYGCALAVFVLALLSKTVTATLPGALLVLFWWQRGEMSMKRDVLPLAPFLFVGAGGGLITARWELQFNQCVGPDFQFTSAERLLIAGRAVWFHLWKLFWPANLTFIYPRWQLDPSQWWQVMFPLGVVAAAILLWAVRRRSRAPLAGFLFFCGTLFPVLGFFNLYTFRYTFVANHYKYLASLGMIVLASSGIATVLSRFNPRLKSIGTSLCVLLPAALGSLTLQQSARFANAETLYRATLAGNPSCWLAYTNLGNLFVDQGKFGEAKAQFSRALEIKPDLASAYNGLGIATVGEGDLENGIHSYRRAIELQPDYPEALNNLGVALARAHRYPEAIESYQKSTQLDPGYAMAHYNLANALARLNRVSEAEQQYREAIRIMPDLAFAHYYLGLALLSGGRDKEAAEHLDRTFELRPDFFQGYYEVGNLQLQRGRLDESIASYRKALAAKPDFAEAHCNLGTALSRRGQYEDAIGQYREALRLRPNYSQAANNLGRALEESGRIDEAIAMYSEALRMDPHNATAKGNLERASPSRSPKAPLSQK